MIEKKKHAKAIIAIEKLILITLHLKRDLNGQFYYIFESVYIYKVMF